MSTKRTKAEQLQRNAERLDGREEARPKESEINFQRSEPASGNTV